MTTTALQEKLARLVATIEPRRPAYDFRKAARAFERACGLPVTLPKLQFLEQSDAEEQVQAR